MHGKSFLISFINDKILQEIGEGICSCQKNSKKVINFIFYHCGVAAMAPAIILINFVFDYSPVSLGRFFLPNS